MEKQKNVPNQQPANLGMVVWWWCYGDAGICMGLPHRNSWRVSVEFRPQIAKLVYVTSVQLPWFYVTFAYGKKIPWFNKSCSPKTNISLAENHRGNSEPSHAKNISRDGKTIALLGNPRNSRKKSKSPVPFIDFPSHGFPGKSSKSSASTGINMAWCKAKTTGNHGFDHQICGFPVPKFPIIQVCESKSKSSTTPSVPKFHVLLLAWLASAPPKELMQNSWASVKPKAWTSAGFNQSPQNCTHHGKIN